jgi:hypothetical protein
LEDVILKHFRITLFFALLALCGSVALAQGTSRFPGKSELTNLYDVSTGFGGTGLFTQSITNQTNVPHQAETGSVGFLTSFRDHPVRFLDIEVNYQYSSYTERFTPLTARPVLNVALAFHEFTAGYVFHRHPDRLHPLKPLPFLVIGGGEIYFNPSPGRFNTQFRPTGLVELGADVPTFNPHVSYRLAGRVLPYRAPNFDRPEYATSAWHATIEPAISVILHY